MSLSYSLYIIEVLRCCCAHDPEKRPTASELLMSGLLPSKMEVESEYLEQALAVTCNHKSTSFPLLVNRLFSQPSRPHTDFVWEGDAAMLSESRKLECYLELLKQVFAIHNAEFLMTPLVRPRSGIFDPPLTAAGVELLTHDGEVALLPSNLSVPIARYLAQLRCPRHKSYSFGQVFVPSQVEESGSGAPKEKLEASFNIVDCHAHTSGYLAAECVLVGLTAAKMLKRGMDNSSNLAVRLGIGDSKLMSNLLQVCGCTPPSLCDIQNISDHIVSHMRATSSAPAASNNLKLSGGGDMSCLNHLFRALPSDPLKAIAELENRVDWIFRNATKSGDITAVRQRAVRSAWECFGRLREVCQVLSVLGVYEFEESTESMESNTAKENHKWASTLLRPPPVAESISLDLALTDNHNVFASGIIFEVYLEPRPDRLSRSLSGYKDPSPASSMPLGQRITVALGGSYAELLALFRRPPVRRSDPTVGMGLRIPLYDIAKASTLSEALANSLLSQLASSQSGLSQNVLVAGFAEGSAASNQTSGLLERLYIAHLLWENGVRAEHLMSLGAVSRSVETLTADCRRRGVAHLVLVKPHLLHKEGSVKVINLNHSHPHFANVHVNELPKRILTTTSSNPSAGSSKSPCKRLKCQRGAE
jgi:hypothetical protein